MRCVSGLCAVKAEPEVRSWLAGLSDRDFGRVDFLAGLLAEQAELRFHLLTQPTRVTYWLAPGRRVILLTVFRKTRSAETADVSRALQAQKACEAERRPAHVTFDREVP